MWSSISSQSAWDTHLPEEYLPWVWWQGFCILPPVCSTVKIKPALSESQVCLLFMTKLLLLNAGCDNPILNGPHQDVVFPLLQIHTAHSPPLNFDTRGVEASFTHFYSQCFISEKQEHAIVAICCGCSQEFLTFQMRSCKFNETLKDGFLGYFYSAVLSDFYHAFWFCCCCCSTK